MLRYLASLLWMSVCAPLSLQPRAMVPPPSALAAFNASLEGTLVTPSDAGYGNASLEWNARIAVSPYAVVFASGEADVSLTLAFASLWSLRLALRSGRHQVEGWSACDGCLVLDVSSLTGLVVDAVTLTATVGAGVTLGVLLNVTAPLGLHTPTGSCSSVGVAGYILGGGIGWTSRLYGLGVDNLLGARVVLANGSVVVASGETGGMGAGSCLPPCASPQDLLWALSGGGGGNFGVVTSLTLALHPLPPRLLYAEFTFPWTVAPTASQAYLDLAYIDASFMFYCLFVRPSIMAEPLVLLQGIYLGDLSTGFTVLQPLVDLAAAANASGLARSNISVTDYLTAHRLFEGPLGTRTSNKQKSAFVRQPAASMLVRAPALDIIARALLAAPADVADNSAVCACLFEWHAGAGGGRILPRRILHTDNHPSALCYALHPLPPTHPTQFSDLNALQHAIAVPASNATSFVHRDATLNCVIDTHWLINTTTPEALSWTRSLHTALADAGVLGPEQPLPTYVNYADAELTEEAWPQVRV